MSLKPLQCTTSTTVKKKHRAWPACSTAATPDNNKRPRNPKQQRRKMRARNTLPRLTHFVAVPCNHVTSIVDKLQEVQATIVAADPALRACLVDSAKAHFTLAVMSLPTSAEESRTVAALKSAVAAGAGEAPFELKLQGLGTFGDRVLFMQPVEDAGLQRLCRLAGLVSKELVEAGIDVRDANRPFTAHLTVAKVRRQNGAITIESGTYATHNADPPTGPVPVFKLQLLEMRSVPDGQYYNMVAEVQLPTAVNH